MESLRVMKPTSPPISFPFPPLTNEQVGTKRKHTFNLLLEQGGLVTLPPLDFSKIPRTSAFTSRPTSPPSPSYHHDSPASSSPSSPPSFPSSPQKQLPTLSISTPSNTVYTPHQIARPMYRYDEGLRMPSPFPPTNNMNGNTSPMISQPHKNIENTSAPSILSGLNLLSSVTTSTSPVPVESKPQRHPRDQLGPFAAEISKEVEATLNFPIDSSRLRSSSVTTDATIRQLRKFPYSGDFVDYHVAQIKADIYSIVLSHVELLKGEDKKIRCPFGNQCNKAVKGRGNFRKHVEWHLRTVEEDSKHRLEVTKYQMMSEDEKKQQQSLMKRKETAQDSLRFIEYQPVITDRRITFSERHIT